MHLNRRQFHGLLMAGAATVMAKTPALAGVSQSRVALNRLTFGASVEDTQRIEAMGLEAWLNAELAKPEIDDALAARLSHAKLLIEYGADKDELGHTWKAMKEDRAYQYLSLDRAAMRNMADYSFPDTAWEERIRPAKEIQAASLVRAVHADAQLREVMTQFWHDHFSVNAQKNEVTAAYFGLHDQITRRNALGNFRVLIGEMARSPSMLEYLNNVESRASPANENFARELMELHTLGAENYANDKYDRWGDVPGAKEGLASAYIDEDVYEAARALTGWSIGDGRNISEGDNTPKTGEFFYIDKWHDPYQKRILGIEIPPNGAPMADGEKLFDILSGHPGTARFISRKIIRRLFQNEPGEALVQSTAALFLAQKDAPDQIAQLVRHIVLSPQFSSTKPEKLKRPFEFLASYYRALGADVSSPQLDFHWALTQTGWTQHEVRPPTGHSDKNDYWANTNYISGMVTILLNALEDGGNAGKLDFAAQLPAGVTKIAEAAAYFLKRMTGNDVATALARELALAIDGDADTTLPDDTSERNFRLRGMMAMAAFHPDFLYR